MNHRSQSPDTPGPTNFNFDVLHATTNATSPRPPGPVSPAGGPTMTGPSALVADGLAAATLALESEIELLATPVESATRAVAIAQSLTGGPKRIVIKVDTDPSRAAAERAALEAFAESITVPQVLFTHDERSTSVTGLSFLPGDPLDLARADTAIWIQAGAALRSIHDLDTTAGEWRFHNSHPTTSDQWRDDLVTQARFREMIDAATAARFTTITDIRRPDDVIPTIIHGDASAQHFLQRDQKLIGVIDLGDAGLGDPAYDLATLTLWQESRLEDVMSGYGGDDDASAMLRSRVAFYRPLRQLAAAIWSHDHGFKPTAYVVALYEELLKPVL